MLTAEATKGPKSLGKVFAPTAPENIVEAEDSYFYCPVCDETLIHVSEGSDGTTAHFRHKVEPDHPRISEGKTHRMAKMKLYNELKEVNSRHRRKIYENLTLEKVLRSKISSEATDSLFEREYEIADLYFEYQNNKCVVEFQCSSQGWRQFKLRTMYYNLHGYKVLWILDKDLITTDKEDRYICREAFYNLSKMYDGRLYFFDPVRDRIFAGKFQNWSAKTRASKLSTNVVKQLTAFNCDIGGLGDTFRFKDKLSYSDLKNGTDLRDNWKVGGLD